MKTRSFLALVVSAASLLLTACGTTGSTADLSPAPATAAMTLTGFSSAGGDVLSGSFGHEAIGASQINFSQNDKARQVRAQADYDYRSYVIWKSSQKSE